MLAMAVPSVAAAEPQAAAAPPGAIAIGADRGIEWQRTARVLIARGNATAVRGDTKVRADVLTARYREQPDGSIEVWRIDAEGAVKLTSPQESATGELGTYDIDGGTMSLSGGKQLSVTTPSGKITAQNRIDYDIGKRKLVARGDAIVTEGDRTLQGDVVTIWFADDPQGGTRPQRIEADGAMRMITPNETVAGDRGTYDVESQLAVAIGSVQVVQGANRLSGCRGEMNFRTGVSRMLACPGERNGGRVQGVILPNTGKNK